MIRLKMVPHPDQMNSEESGIRRVIEAYARYLPDHGFEIVPRDAETFDLGASHAGTGINAHVVHTHGLYWTADYDAASWEWKANGYVIEAVRRAKIVTVPSRWVAETFQRDMHLTPRVAGHGIDVDLWEPGKSRGYALWNKNRTGDVCDPRPVRYLAQAFKDHKFISTFIDRYTGNVETTGIIPHDQMKDLIRHAHIYLATTKETFGIGILEAMASGIPVLGFAHGGALDIVRHGVDGYLAEPNNMDDLIQGYEWINKYHDRLRGHAVQRAKQFMWERAVENVAQIYRDALEVQPATVSIIIPTYNYADKVGEAIQSAVEQTYSLIENIFVVDDGSTDDGATARVVKEWEKKDSRVRYIWKENGGVATARNRGIAEAKGSTLVCCLDADDRIEPEFIQRCVMGFEGDRSLGITYTKLRYIKPDGTTGVSQWPDEFDYDKQLKKQNQIPTCCVFKREMWERLGGYRQRYAPKGAGAEDAEFWLRAGAIGYNAKLATSEPLFIYSWQSGRVSGNKEYREPDWLGWHPWVEDGFHPFASQATPGRFSHPVRQYDEPVISVIIPVGPGHEDYLCDAIDSLESQFFRKWEVIIIDDTLMRHENREKWEAIKKNYPFARIYQTTGEVGAGFARNMGAIKARAPFLVFLDADDLLYPDALRKMLLGWREQEAIIYTNYVGKSRVDDPDKLADDIKLYSYEDGVAIAGHALPDYDPELAQAQPYRRDQANKPYLWCNVTCLIPKIWHDEIGGFDETMDTWEDVEYHWRMSKAGKCYAHIPEELMVYRFDTGSRRFAGVESFQRVLDYVEAKHKEIEVVGCNCGGKTVKAQSPRPAPNMMASGVNVQEGNTVADQEFQLVRYMHGNKGQHKVIGVATKTNYGYRKGGDTFLVHADDIAAQPHLFNPERDRLTSPAPPPQAPRPPEPVPHEVVEEAEPEAEQPHPTTRSEVFNTFGEEVGSKLVEAGFPSLTSLMGVGVTTLMNIGLTSEEAQTVREEVEPLEEFDLTALPGVTQDIARQMKASGVNDPEDISKLTLDDLMEYKGLGQVKAEGLKAAVEAILAAN